MDRERLEDFSTKMVRGMKDCLDRRQEFVQIKVVVPATETEEAATLIVHVFREDEYPKLMARAINELKTQSAIQRTLNTIGPTH